MLLSNKYRIVEDTTQITLYELVARPVLSDDKTPTGETKTVEKLLGYYSNTPRGKSQSYSRIINNEISSLEKQTLQEVLDTVKRCEEQVVEFWQENK